MARGAPNDPQKQRYNLKCHYCPRTFTGHGSRGLHEKAKHHDQWLAGLKPATAADTILSHQVTEGVKKRKTKPKPTTINVTYGTHFCPNCGCPLRGALA